MEGNIQSLILAFGILNTISFVFSLALYLDNKQNKLFKLNCLYWASLMFLFVAQGIFVQTDVGILLGFCFTAVYVYVHVFVIQELFKIKLPTEIYLPLLISGVIISPVLSYLGINFTYSAIPLAFTSGLVLIHSALKTFTLRKTITFSLAEKLFIIAVVLCGIHILDFPFLRKNEDMTFMGFYIAFLLAIFMAVLLPYFIAEETQKNYSTALKEEVSLKTRELHAANAKLGEIALERQNLIHLICHDLNNHLMIQLNFNQYLNKMNNDNNFSTFDKDFDQKLGRSQKVLESQRGLTTKINLMSSLEAGKLTVQMASVNLLDAISTSLDLLDSLIQDKKIHVICRCAESINIFADKTLLINSVINNLLVNAIKFSPIGGTLQLRAFIKDKHVWFVIKDYGVGIPAEQIKHLFSRTKNISTRGTNGEKGSGFGMPIVHSILEKFGGRIIVKSNHNYECDDINGTAVFLVLKYA